MEDLSSYSSLARTATEAEFVAQSNPLFLVKRPKFRPSQARAPMAISFETQHTKLEVDPYATEWRVAQVRKREGNPYPDRFSIGRAPNCDVVIRLPSVSKVHAHILVNGPQSYAVRDNQASNSTFVNGRKLETKGTAQLHIGDELAFGSLELEFVDAARFYQILRTEVALSQSHGPLAR
ncbi:MAG TPA: FHA domain-containing protein [Polyangiaceae bacterium]